ncbi:MAG: DUF2817 domain-containing protein [Zetaproteobacteria bacterium CG06_land_8_20_14_3_00_59_53]|nr:MAG: hypothetical protein AUK36_06145 [Zetaproteobacteria bacterium CG2_30_59_37]PIO90628.1 MAG: hypothetical protein COX56_02455 [Zetaproteobacteria bacterium CG23_combo_of_CG06-09_8_20_14_all_59_86]PIQ66108.1 MAG: hypothetical protein COV97_00500 [Zetaproteobacteria bacterium CG11_big_fil_rev_8_21_14_0_20_59_439]PIU71575.1 MAG: DUF2817 domain-containing protein [Zetaproteobacteria bacterium CG06_land_8_20_14_3_00_59_53]PIU97836.1 MAG: DUF2817 domain-containing protein [Zetaproteobacteria b
MPDLSCFSSDYQRARTAFLAAAGQAGARLTTHPHPLCGPEGEPLATDVAWLGDPDAGNVLLLLSATHGVEGFNGSAAQIDFLRHHNGLPEGVAALLIHAANPHGFAWLRRVTEDGVDLNRNYVDFSKPLPANPGYEELADAIVPDSLDVQALHACDKRLSDYRSAHGSVSYEKALSAGQYTHPHGLFYGGRAITWSRSICERIAADFMLADRKQVALLDFHTGLGPFGYGEPICDHHPESLAVALARRWYGDSVTEPALGTSSSVAKFGLSDYGWQDIVGPQLVFIALEFGTYSFDNMMQVLRADHWLHAQGAVDWHAPQTQAIKAAIRRQFYPATPDWQEMVLMRCRQCIRQAVRGLSCGA